MLLLAQIQPTSYIFNLSQLILFQQALSTNLSLLNFAIVPNSYCFLLSHAVESQSTSQQGVM